MVIDRDSATGFRTVWYGVKELGTGKSEGWSTTGNFRDCDCVGDDAAGRMPWYCEPLSLLELTDYYSYAPEYWYEFKSSKSSI